MSRSQRDKGLRGEHEVRELYERHGLEVRGLEATGDHLIVCAPGSGLTIHSEVKRQETARPWAWWEQASTEAPAGAMPVVAFRRNRSQWLGIVDLEQLAELVARLGQPSRREESTDGEVL